MTHKETVKTLKAIRNYGDPRKYPSDPWPVLDALIAALESEPEPLAEVEASAIYDIAIDGFAVDICLWLEDAPREDFPVTVTITERPNDA